MYHLSKPVPLMDAFLACEISGTRDKSVGPLDSIKYCSLYCPYVGISS